MKLASISKITNKTGLISFYVAISAIAILLGVASGSAATGANDCPDVSIIFARGSNQQYVRDYEDNLELFANSQPQAAKFLDEINRRKPSELTSRFIQLDYPATPVDFFNFNNSLNAEWSWFGSIFDGDYNDSVAQGEQDLKAKTCLG